MISFEEDCGGVFSNPNWFRTRIEALEKDKVILAKNLNSQREANLQLSDENDRLQQENGKLENENHDLHQENKKLKTEVNYLRLEVQSQMNDFNKSQERVRDLREENEEIMNKLREVERDYEDLSKKHDELQATLETQEIEPLPEIEQDRALTVEMRSYYNENDIAKLTNKVNEIIDKVNQQNKE